MLGSKFSQWFNQTFAFLIVRIRIIDLRTAALRNHNDFSFGKNNNKNKWLYTHFRLLIDFSSTKTARILRILLYGCVFLASAKIGKTKIVTSASEVEWTKQHAARTSSSVYAREMLWNTFETMFSLLSQRVFILYYHLSTTQPRDIFSCFHVGS